MTREQFDALVQRIERRFGSRPFALRLRVALMVALGYAGFLAGFLLMFLAGAGMFLGAGAIDTVPGLLLLVGGSLLLTFGGLQACDLLWVQIEPCPGRELRREEASGFWETLARLRAALKAARCDRVLVTPEFNAGVQQVPRLGVFGWPRNHLHLGLPLLEALSPQEFEAVLAHEMAHLSARDGRFSAWVYRLRRTWQRVFERLHEPANSTFARGVRWLAVKFIDWYWPRFNAYAFVLSRANEYAADGFAAQWAGVSNMASALWRLECLTQRIEEKFWPDLWQLANVESQPPADVMTRLGRLLREAPEPADASRYLERAANMLTDNLDTHPRLPDRLRALHCTVGQYRASGFPGVAEPCAAAVWLGENLPAIRRGVEEVWQREVGEAWRNRHGHANSLTRRLAALEQVPRDPESDPDLLWEKAAAILARDGPAAAEPLLRRLLSLRPAHAAANLVLGRHLLERGQAEGEGLLRRILEGDDEEMIPHACEALARHFQSAGLTDRLREVRGRLSRHEEALAAAGRERSSVSAFDRLLPHELTPEELASLQETLGRQPDLAAAHLVRKELKHFPRQRLFVLSVRSGAHRWGWSRAGRDAALLARLVPQVRLPGRVFVVASQPGFRALARKVARARGAQVYPPMPQPKS